MIDPRLPFSPGARYYEEVTSRPDADNGALLSSELLRVSVGTLKKFAKGFHPVVRERMHALRPKTLD